jgi:hypothetical protein
MTQVDLIYEVYAEGERPDDDWFSTPLYEAADGAGARRACQAHYEDGLGGGLDVYRRGVKIAHGWLGEFGVVFTINQGMEW